MKAQELSPQSLKSHGIQNSVNFGIKSSGLHHILGILRNQLYSDKVLAVLREYTCNAVDAHTQAGCPERPIEVILPNAMNPFIKIRDFGDALTDQEIQDVYAFYGESTKRNTNDQIGMLGIGSKAAFAYGDNFVINSFIDGKKHVYNAFIDPSQVGQISKLQVEDTDEENGIEIVVPVNDDDAAEFKSKAYDLFKWFKVRPIVKGVDEFKYDDKEVLFSGDDWKWLNTYGHSNYYRSDEPMAVMGNIGYPLDIYALNLKDSKLKELMKENLILEVPIGDLEISASREKLQYTEYTKKNLIEKLERVRDELAKEITKDFSKCKTLFDAKCLHGTLFDYGNNLYALRKVFEDKLIFKGQVVNESSFSVFSSEGVSLHKMEKGQRGGKYRLNETNTIGCHNDVVVILNDVGHRRGSLGKLLPFVFEEKKTVYLIGYDKIGTWKKWLKESKFDAKLAKLSELPKRPLSDFYGTVTSSGNSAPKSAKHSQKVFSVDWEVAKRMRWEQQRSKCWEPEDVDLDNDSGVYVILDRFFVEGITDSTNSMPSYTFVGDIQIHAMCNLKDSLKAMGIDMPKFYGVKLKQKAKVEANENMVLLWDWIREKVGELIESKNLQQSYVDRVEAIDMKNNQERDWFYVIDEAKLDDIKDAVVDKDGLFNEFLAKWKGMKHDGERQAIDQLRQITQDLNIELSLEDYKPTHDIKGLKKKVDDQYELLELVKSNFNWNYEKSVGQKIANYINVIDVCNVNG